MARGSRQRIRSEMVQWTSSLLFTEPPPRFRFVASASPWSTPSSRAGFLPPAAVMGIGSCNAALEARKGHPFVALGSDPLHLSHVCGLPLAGGRWMRPMQLWRT